MVPEELLQALRKEVLADLPEETRLKIMDIAQDVAATSGTPRNQQESMEMIEKVRERVRTEMPEAWRDLSTVGEKNRETYERLQKIVPELARNSPNGFSQRTGGNGGTLTLDPDGSPSVDKLLSELLSQSAQGRGRLPSSRNGNGNGTGTGTGRNSTQRIIEQLMRDDRQTQLARQSPTGSATHTNTPPRRDNPSDARHQSQQAKPAPTMKDQSNLTMSERFNQMLKDVADRTNQSDSHATKRNKSKLGGFEPYFDKFSKSIQESVNDSIAKSTNRSRSRRGTRSNERESFLGLARRDRGQPPPTPPKYSLSEVAVPFFLLLTSLMVWLSIRNRAELIQGADRYLSQFSQTRRQQVRGTRPDGLVEAVDELVLRQFDAEATIWNHSQVQAALNTAKPDLRGDIRQLMTIYKSARYSPQPSADTRQSTQTRSLLDKLHEALAEGQEGDWNERELAK